MLAHAFLEMYRDLEFGARCGASTPQDLGLLSRAAKQHSGATLRRASVVLRPSPCSESDQNAARKNQDGTVVGIGIW